MIMSMKKEALIRNVNYKLKFDICDIKLYIIKSVNYY